MSVRMYHLQKYVMESGTEESTQTKFWFESV